MEMSLLLKRLLKLKPGEEVSFSVEDFHQARCLVIRKRYYAGAKMAGAQVGISERELRVTRSPDSFVDYNFDVLERELEDACGR